MVYKENKLENPISLSGHGTQSGTEGTDPTPMPERERVGEALSPVLGESKAAPPATPQQIVQATCQTLGFRPTGAQVSFGVREVADLCVDGFSLLEIAQGARYVAEQGWVRSFAGVKYYLPQALTRLALKAAQERDTSSACRGMGERDEYAGLSAGVSRSEAAEQSPHRALWDRVREKIAPRIHPQSYRTWFAPTYIADYDGQRVVLNVPSLFFLDWLEEHYLALIEAVFEEVLGRAVEVFFQTPEGGG